MNQQYYDKTSPKSIFEYAIPLLDHTLREVVGDEAVEGYNMSGKGTLGQMVEELYYHYKANSNPTPDFEEAGLELKTTGLKKLKDLSTSTTVVNGSKYFPSFSVLIKPVYINNVCISESLKLPML